MARLHRLGRAHSHEGVTQGYHYHTDPDTDHGTFVLKFFNTFLVIDYVQDTIVLNLT